MRATLDPPIFSCMLGTSHRFSSLFEMHTGAMSLYPMGRKSCHFISLHSQNFSRCWKSRYIDTLSKMVSIWGGGRRGSGFPHTIELVCQSSYPYQKATIFDVTYSILKRLKASGIDAAELYMICLPFRFSFGPAKPTRWFLVVHRNRVDVISRELDSVVLIEWTSGHILFKRMEFNSVSTQHGKAAE